MLWISVQMYLSKLRIKSQLMPPWFSTISNSQDNTHTQYFCASSNGQSNNLNTFLMVLLYIYMYIQQNWSTSQSNSYLFLFYMKLCMQWIYRLVCSIYSNILMETKLWIKKKKQKQINALCVHIKETAYKRPVLPCLVSSVVQEDMSGCQQ